MSAFDLTPFVSRIVELAWDHEPDWNAVYEGSGHNWCEDASREVAAYLCERGLEARVVTGGLCGCHHTWVELSDGTILDPTIEQYIDRTDEILLDQREVPWLATSENAQIEGRLAVIAPAHPLAGEYERPAGG